MTRSLASFSPPGSPPAPSWGRDALDELSAAGWRAAQTAWPDVELPAALFRAHVAERVGDAALSLDDLRQLRWAELYLACACARGDGRAHALFEARYFPGIGALLVRMGLDAPRVDELTQRLRAHLFLGDGERRPRIGDYAGRGALASWLRVTVVRAAVKQLRRERRELPLEDEKLAELSTSDGDAELQYLKHLYRPLFRDAFVEVLGTLPARELNLLRQHYLDGVTIEQLARMHQTHRGTVARWLDRIRHTLLDRTRRSVMQRVRLPQAGCDSLIRLVRSQFDLSLQELLRCSG